MSAAASTNSDDKSKTSDEIQAKPDKSAGYMLFVIAADTTWRMFVPVLLGMALGSWLDAQFGLKPWASIGGVVFGLLGSGILVRKQYKKANI
ncbi:AtpZ/AtpI family protein [Candidatus Saccharibacteria bacterium]|jgi:F0F1-type ATP synthase assembly protein I|nr:AtpZ/AtpI family protein [Candidatus Saccharibacteria bacterium]